MKQNKQKNLYLQNIIEAYNPYNNLNASASCYELYGRKETIQQQLERRAVLTFAKRLQNWQRAKQKSSIIYKARRKGRWQKETIIPLFIEHKGTLK